MQKQNPLLRVWELGKSQHSGLICAVISAFLGVLGGMLPYFAAAQMIVNLLGGNRDMSLYLKWLCIGMAGYLVRTLLYTLALSISHKATFSVLKTIRQKILEKLPKLPLGTVTDMSSGKMKQLIVDQVDGMETTLAHLFPELTANIAGPILIIVYLFILDWRMALLSLVSIPAGMVFLMTVMGSYSRDYEGAVGTTKEMNETIVEYINGIEVIKAFNQGKSSYAKFSDRVKANAKYYYNWMKKSQFGMSMAYSIVPATLITILPVGFVFYLGGSLSAEVFITIVILSLGITGPLIAAMNFVDTLAQVGTTVEAVDEILLAEEQQHGEKAVTFGKMDIGLSHVSFGYHGDKEILHDVSLEIPAGTMTALVGPSGSGKSTIAKLIAGFWDVQSGKVTIGGIDEKIIPLEQLYEQAAFVSQDNFLFDETVRENIRMGRMSATDAEIEAACRAAGCDGFIRELEKGYDTKVGSGGAHLSGGERQRIAIARAMLKDAPIVILDEATAYIDPENEAVIQKAIAKLVKGKTVIVIAHRLSTIKDADKIVVVKDGRIAASGRHEELRESSPLYESMWQAHIGAKDGDMA
ncbi:ABC transporter ATP-binding protein [Parablautia intestinalis]|uniref:ABC transporter ATP-binding protein n=1 Tax=Parablautia intestinalis TaxID=2320100 RepID=UPI00256F5ABD|nr:ABC transporter ATP-binding protein [Parablautia intestinalis]